MDVLGWSVVPQQVENAAAFLILAALSALLMSAAKAGFGGSVGLLSVPLMIYACGGSARLATGILLPLLIACDYVSMCFWLGRWRTKVVAALLPGTAVGVALGWAGLWAVGRYHAGAEGAKVNTVMKLAIGVIALGFVILQAARALRRKPPTSCPGRWRSAGIGAAAGLASTFAHSAGPITSMYMLRQNLPKKQFVASTVLYYWIANQMKLVPYFALGLINPDSLGASACLVPAAVAGALLGVFLHRRVGQKQFAGIVYVLLALAGAHLCAQASRSLW
jgi:uncharacterized membrane protein YfcA